MKMRNGHVSNSSSSSFVLMPGGWRGVTAEDIAEAIRSRIAGCDQRVAEDLARCASLGIGRSELELGGELFAVFDLSEEDGRRRAEDCLEQDPDAWIAERTGAAGCRKPRFLIRLAENVLPDVIGMQEEGGSWRTADMTEGRFLEILTSELVSRGALPYGSEPAPAVCCLRDG